MARRLDELYWDLRANTKALKSDFQEARQGLRGIQEDADATAAAFSEIGSAGQSGLRHLRRELETGARTASDAARQIASSFEEEFVARAGEAGQKLREGLISQAAFDELGREAAKQFNDALVGLIGQARVADIPELEIQLAARMKGAGEEGARAFAEAAKQAARREAIGDVIMSQIESEFQARRAQATEELARGLIDPEEFERRGRRAAERMRTAILQELDKLQAAGRLDETTFRQLTEGLEKAGATGGVRFGEQAEKGARAGLTRLERFIRGGFRATIVGAFLFAAQRMTRAFARPVIEFESAMAGVAKTVDASEEEIRDLGKAFQEISSRIPVSTNELARLGQVAGQLGVETANIADFVEVVAKLGAAVDDLSPEQAATELARLANVLQVPQDQFENLASTLVALGNQFATTEGEILHLAQRLAGAGRGIGLTAGEILGFATALRAVGVEAEAGGTALSRVFISIQDAVLTGSDSLQTFARVAGLTVDEFSQLFRQQAATAINRFIEGLRNLVEAGGSVTPVLEAIGLNNVRVRDALLRTVGASDQLTDALRVGNRAFAENIALQEEAARRFETTASRMQVLRNRANTLATNIGERLLPAFIATLEKANFLIGALTRLEEAAGGQGAKRGLDAFNASIQQLKGLGEPVRRVEELRAGVERLAAQLSEDVRPIFFEQAADAISQAGGTTGRTLEETAQGIRRLFEILRTEAGPAGETAAEALARVRAELEDFFGGGGAPSGAGRQFDAAQKSLKQLNAEIELLQRFGVVTFEQLTDPLASAVREVVALDREIEELNRTIQEAQRAPTERERARLDELARRRSRLFAEAERIAETPEGRIAADAREAIKEVEHLARVRRFLRDIGLDELAEAPAAVLEAFQALREAETALEEHQRGLESIRRQREQMIELGDFAGADEMERAIVVAEALEAALAGDVEEAQRLLSAFGGLGDALEDFPDLATSLFAGLDPQQAEAVVNASRGVVEALREVAQARREELVAQAAQDPEAEAQARRRLAAAQKRLKAEIATTTRALVAMGIPLEKIVELFQQLGIEIEKPEESASKLLETLKSFEGIARGVLSVADAMGVLDQRTRRTLQGMIDVAEAAGRIAAGDLAGGIAQGIGGLAGLASGIFGGGPDERRLSAAMARLEISLDRLRNDVRALRGVFSELTGRQLELGRELVGRVPVLTDTFWAPVQRRMTQDLPRAMEDLGISITDLAQIAGAAGQDIDLVLRLLAGERLSSDELREAALQWQNFVKAVDEFSLSRALETLGGQLDLLRRRFELFDVEEPVKQWDAFLAAIQQFAPDLASALAGIDVSTPEGRQRAKELLQDAFEGALEGQFPSGLTFDEMLDLLGEGNRFLERISEQGPEGGEGDISTIVRRTITEVTANRLAALLTTLVILDGQQVELLRLILTALGGEAPESTAIPTPAFVGLEALMPGRSIELDERRNRLLEEIRDRMTPPGPMRERELEPPPNWTPESHPRFPEVHVAINGFTVQASGDSVEDFYRDVELDGGERLADAVFRPIDRRLGVYLRRMR